MCHDFNYQPVVSFTYVIDIDNVALGKTVSLLVEPKMSISFSNDIFYTQIMITVAINGATMSSKEIDQMSGAAHLYTSPRLSFPPAVGLIRDAAINSELGECHKSLIFSKNL